MHNGMTKEPEGGRPPPTNIAFGEARSGDGANPH
jgi:hypothetical protein